MAQINRAHYCVLCPVGDAAPRAAYRYPVMYTAGISPTLRGNVT
jgi:hypothetical protein